MKAPTITQAYAMIRALKKRAAKGDGEIIQQLEVLIEQEKNKEALLDVEKFFPKKP